MTTRVRRCKNLLKCQRSRSNHFFDKNFTWNFATDLAARTQRYSKLPVRQYLQNRITSTSAGVRGVQVRPNKICFIQEVNNTTSSTRYTYQICRFCKDSVTSTVVNFFCSVFGAFLFHRCRYQFSFRGSLWQQYVIQSESMPVSAVYPPTA